MNIDNGEKYKICNDCGDEITGIIYTTGNKDFCHRCHSKCKKCEKYKKLIESILSIERIKSVEEKDYAHILAKIKDVGLTIKEVEGVIKCLKTKEYNIVEEYECCNYNESEQYRSRVLTGSLGLEGNWSEWKDGKPEKIHMNKEYQYRKKKKITKYITMQEYIDTAEERNMTKEEAAVVFKEVCMANINNAEVKIEDSRNYYIGLNDNAFHIPNPPKWVKFKEDWPKFGSFTENYRIELDKNEKIPYLPILECSDIENDVATLYCEMGQYWGVSHVAGNMLNGSIYSKLCNTKIVAVALNNKWMRERFGAKYE